MFITRTRPTPFGILCPEMPCDLLVSGDRVLSCDRPESDRRFTVRSVDVRPGTIMPKVRFAYVTDVNGTERVFAPGHTARTLTIYPGRKAPLKERSRTVPTYGLRAAMLHLISHSPVVRHDPARLGACRTILREAFNPC